MNGSVIQEIAAERKRQIEVEGWAPEHDDVHHVDGELARAAAAYADFAHCDETHRVGRQYATDGNAPGWWPWLPEWWKPKDRRRDLIRAAALIVAEIERLDRIKEQIDGR